MSEKSFLEGCRQLVAEPPYPCPDGCQLTLEQIARGELDCPQCGAPVVDVRLTPKVLALALIQVRAEKADAERLSRYWHRQAVILAGALALIVPTIGLLMVVKVCGVLG